MRGLRWQRNRRRGNLNYRGRWWGGAKFPQTFETCFFGWMGIKLPIMSAGLEIQLAGTLQMSWFNNEHVVTISPYRERKAAVYELFRSIGVGIFEVTAREHCLLRGVERYRSKLLPVTNGRVLNDQFVNREFTLFTTWRQHL